MNFDVALWLVKFAHVTGIALWAGGMFVLPHLFRKASKVSGDEHHRLHRMVRQLYVQMMSPAAFVAVGTGTGLIFMRETFVAWFSLKLVGVGVLAGLHILAGLLVVGLFRVKSPASFGWIKTWMMTAVTLGAVMTILWFVLAKPEISSRTMAGLFEPGALRDTLLPLIPWMTP